MWRMSFVVMGLAFLGLVAGIRLWPDYDLHFAAACALASLVAGFCIWRFQGRRDAGAATAFAGLVAIACCLQFIPSGRWPTNLNGAIEEVRSWLSVGERRDLAYRAPAEMVWLHMSLGMSVRNDLGLYQGNLWLLSDCGEFSSSPDDCSDFIIRQLQQRLRAELPASEQVAIKDFESRIERVTIPDREFKDAPVTEVIAWLQAAIDQQLPSAERIFIELDPESAGARITANLQDATLGRSLSLIDTTTASVEKRLPNLRIEPYYQRVSPEVERAVFLQPLLFVGNGINEDRRELIRDPSTYQAAWKSLSPAPPRAVDFSKHSVLLVALGESPMASRGVIQGTLLGKRDGVVHIEVVEQQWYGACAAASPPPRPRPTALLLIPARVDHAAYSFHEFHTSCDNFGAPPAIQAVSPDR